LVFVFPANFVNEIEAVVSILSALERSPTTPNVVALLVLQMP
jgi:hypothetical protein